MCIRDSPLHSTRHAPSPIERAALRTLNAACKRIDLLGSCSGESLLALLDKLLNSIEHILVNDTGIDVYKRQAQDCAYTCIPSRLEGSVRFALS